VAAATGAPALYLITDRRATGGRDLVEVVERALAGIALVGAPGASVAVQLREKDLEGAALLALALRLRHLTAAAGAQLYVNDRIDVALAVGADGVHLGGGSLTPAEVRAVCHAGGADAGGAAAGGAAAGGAAAGGAAAGGAAGGQLAVAVSTHAAAEVARAAGEVNVRFAVLGPIFDTPSKRRFGPPLGTDALAAAARFPLPVLALGGVTVQNIQRCLSDGAAGVACIRAVLEAPDPAEALALLLKSVSTYRRIHFASHLT
jgi:thiamine-phosphate pyrophosphorylase